MIISHQGNAKLIPRWDTITQSIRMAKLKIPKASEDADQLEIP